jgi:ribosomal protein S6--L-glutamate ligase
VQIGVAGIPGAWSTETLGVALAARGVTVTVFSLADCSLDLGRRAVWYDGRDLGQLNGVVVKKLGDSTDPLDAARIRYLQQLEFSGVRVFSPARAIGEVNDRLRMSQILAQRGLPLPRTVVTESVEAAADVIEDWGRAVVKPLQTSKARGMLLLAAGQAHRIKLRRWREEWRMPFYLQQFIPNLGRDIGVTVLGDEVLGAFYRVGSGASWVTSSSAGGHYEPCPLNPEIERLALAAVQAFGLDFSVVDLVESGGEYFMYEVSAFGGFAGLWQSQHVDVAARYADYILRECACSTP